MRLRGIYRFIVFALITAFSLFWMIFLGFVLGENEGRSIRLRRKLAARLVRMLKIEVELKGEVPGDGIIGVTNHRSYIDSVCIFMHLDACPVVKSEVQNWPLVGLGLKHTATVFVERENKISRSQTRERIAEFVKLGVSTIVFVEGTTYVGPEAGEFRPGTFKTAAKHQLPIVPIAIEFEHRDAAWVGDDTFVPHFIRYFGKHRKTKVKVAFGEEMISEDWESLRDQSHQWVNEQLLQMRKEFDASF